MSLTSMKRLMVSFESKNSDILEEDSEMAYVCLITYKKKIKKYFHKHVYSRDFQVRDLVLKRPNGLKKDGMKGKMVTNWEGP